MTTRIDGKDRCVLCGDEVDVPPGKEPRTTIAGQSGKRNVRILSVDNREVHRCEMSEEAETSAQMS